ncbi:uncharacterized protein LOC108484868 [Gossypium arboreum]|uniref:uncharacterized protein LOC108484868 n=1 Tax=Gossypium arboreum TaxID=29729 RepID=UPI0022F16B2C|nr:uncharacterized protein LOC108484868 [Gossypium arboreum]
MTYRELYQNLFNAHVVSPFYLEPLQPSYPKWYDTNAQCEYHAGITGHSIENCTAFKKVVERLIKVGIVKFDDPAMPNVAGNPLPNHTDQGVNRISEGLNKKTKYEVAEVRTPLRRVWKEMAKRGLIVLDSREESKEERNYCEFHDNVGHEIQDYVEFRALVQNMMNNKEIEFYKENENPVEGDICASEEESTAQNRTAMMPGKESPVDASRGDQGKGFYTRSGRCYDTANEEVQPTKEKAQVVEEMKGKATKPINEPVNEEEAKEFLKFLKHSEYSVVEQLHKQPARISMLALLLSSKVHRSALMKVLNETYVANDISVNKLDRLVNNISADNYIFLNNDEIPPGGMGSTKALHITTRCKWYTLSGVLIDNRSALNILPLTMLNRLPIDSSHMKECQNIVKVFDGTERKVMGRIELVSEGRLITIKAEEDIIATVSNNAPYLETDGEAIECSFRSLEFVNAMFIAEGSEILVPKLSKTTRMSLQLTIKRGAPPGRGLGRHLQGRVKTSMPKDKRDRFDLGFKSDAKQKRRELEKK